MKTISFFLVSCLTAFSVFAQYTNTVTIKVNGNRNREVMVDGRSYTINTASTSNTTGNTNTPIVITDLQPGQHTLQVIRNNQNNNNRINNPTTFNLRSGYDMNIAVNGNGSIQLSETRKKKNWNASDNQSKTAMNDASFNVLLQDVQKQWRSNAKRTLVTNAFAKTGNYFTTSQAKQLIQLINGDNYRLELAKASYRTIVDPQNFSLLYDLFSTQANRDALAAYVSFYNANNPNNNSGNYSNRNINSYSSKNAMTDADFNVLYRSIQGEWLPGAKMTALTNTFATTSYYFTTYQARQLIQLVSEENNRLQLAKASYRTIVDPGNFTQLYDILNSQASRNELAAYVSSYSANNSTNNNNNVYNNNQYKAAMTDADFNVLYRGVQSEWLPGAKMSALTNIFANTSYYFNTYQARQLIQLVNDENNRLQLAKASYRTIVDPANFTQLYDVLNSQASRDELTAYVRSYR